MDLHEPEIKFFSFQDSCLHSPEEGDRDGASDLEVGSGSLPASDLAKASVADPVSGAFLTPRSGIGEG
jgi:hypothetical protein